MAWQSRSNAQGVTVRIISITLSAGCEKQQCQSPHQQWRAQFVHTDWNFASRTAPSPIEALHPYPAKFVADLPRRLLDILPVPRGTAVLDPFCGSGTTLVECQRRGVPAVGIDLNPIACLISQVKTSPLAGGLAAAAAAVVGQAAGCKRAANVPDLPRLDHWFAPEVQRALASLTTAIATAPPDHRDALRLALSSIVVRVSNQESDTRYAAIRKKVRAADAFAGFRRAADRIEKALAARDYALAPVAVIESDTTSVNPGELVSVVNDGRRVGLVITSPPYPNAYEYWLYHKYRMYWLGMDPLAVKVREIGARAHFFKRNPHTADDFARQNEAHSRSAAGRGVRWSCFLRQLEGLVKVYSVRLSMPSMSVSPVAAVWSTTALRPPRSVFHGLSTGAISLRAKSAGGKAVENAAPGHAAFASGAGRYASAGVRPSSDECGRTLL